MTNEQTINSQEVEAENIVENNLADDYEKSFAEEALNIESIVEESDLTKQEKTSNGLENFEIEDDAPELFNSGDSLETEDNDQEFSSFAKEENNNEEDELEIPAFLRRQKN